MNAELQLRAVDGYQPSAHMIDITTRDGQPAKYLEVKHRKEWFLLWCQQHNLVGVLDDSNITYDPNSKLVIAKVDIKVDDTVIGSSTACKFYDPNAVDAMATTVFQDVGTIAMGRALANCGFGTVASMETEKTLADAPVAAPAVKNETDPFAFDAPIALPAMEDAVVTQAESASAPAAGTVAPESVQSAQMQPQTPAPAAAPVTPAPKKNFSFQNNKQDIKPVSGYEEALQAIMPFGTFMGKSLGEVSSRKPDMIAFLANRGQNGSFRSAAQYPNLVRACEILCDHGGM